MSQKYTTPSDLQLLAEQALSDLAPVFLEHTGADIKSMKSYLKKAKDAKPVQRFSLIREDFFCKAHDMKGEGATFNYPLLTFMGQVICDYLRHKTKITISDLTFLNDCLTDIQIIFNQKITGDGAQFGADLHHKWGNK